MAKMHVKGIIVRPANGVHSTHCWSKYTQTRGFSLSLTHTHGNIFLSFYDPRISRMVKRKTVFGTKFSDLYASIYGSYNYIVHLDKT